MKRTEVADNYKWNLSHIFKSEAEIEHSFSALSNFKTEIESFKGKIKTADDVFALFMTEEKAEKELAKLGLYSYLFYSEDITNAKAIVLSGKVDNAGNAYARAVSFVVPELVSLGKEFLEGLKADKRFKDYDRTIDLLIKEIPHTLPASEEYLLSGMGEFTDFDSVFDALSDAELKFEPVLENGEKKELTHATYSAFMRSPNADVRLMAHKNMHKKFGEFNLTLTKNYLNRLKYSNYVSKTYKYANNFVRALEGEEVTEKVYNTLIGAVHSHLADFYRFAELKRQKLNLEKMRVCDFYANSFTEKAKTITYEEAQQIVKEALKCLGNDYQKLLERAFAERWIDVFPTENKSSGAYSYSTGVSHPYVMLNFAGTTEDASTLAHELGHAMHSHYSETTQPEPKQQYVIFVAEVASTVNEMLLARYKLKMAKTKIEKQAIAESLLQNFYATVFRQTMFAEFEKQINQKIADSEALAPEDLNAAYEQLLKQYFGSKVELHEYAKFEWSRIPHFYRPFYVYKYATGLVSAIAISQKIVDDQTGEYVKKYKEFLSAGCKADPISLLKIAEVDIEDASTYDFAFKFYNELLNLYAE